MSDFFIPTQKDDYWTKKQQETQTTLPQQNTQNDYWGQRSQVLQQQKEERLANYNRYGVDVPDEYYEQFNKIISQVENPDQAQEEAYRIGSAIKYSQMYGMDLGEAYSKVDALNEANFTDLQDQKGRFEALSDMFNLGTNNVKLGQLGQQLMVANATGDTELAQNLMAQIDALNERNTLLQDNTPRSWVMQALEAGAQSLPFTGYVAAAGLFGNFIAPAVGTGAAFAASSYLSAGQEYLDMLANGASHNTAAIVAAVSGGIQGLIEADLGITSGIVKGAAKTMGKEVAENTAKKAVEDIGIKVAKRFHFGAGKKLLVNYLAEYGKNVLGEGVEEFLQELTSIAGQEIAAAMDGYDIPDDDLKSIVSQTTEAFKGGVLGALALGFVPAGLNANAAVKDYRFIKDEAEFVESPEVFYNEVKDNPVFGDMKEEAKKEVAREIWEKAQQRKEADVELEAKQIAETRDAAEGAEEMPEAEEGEETQAQSVARDESGRLYTSDDGGTFLAGDATKDDANRYGYIKYSKDENGDITIDTFKMTEGREGLREELFDEFAREHPDVNINWNAIGSEAQTMRQSLIDANPSGSKNGLNYYSSKDIDEIAARKKVAAEVRRNIHNVTKNADGSFTRTDLNNKQVAAAVTLIESAAKRMDMSLSDYVNKTFGNNIFGTREQFAQSALAQGDQIADKAGGMNQGVAQANWKQVGQQVKAVIYAGENADFSTWAHEMAHVFQNQLDGDLKTDAETAFNVVNGDWINSKYTFSDGRTMSSAEAFAYGFQDWLETGHAESKQMQNIFQKFAQFIADAYNKLRQHLNFTPEIESVFNKLLDGDDTIMSKALKAAQEEENEYRANLKRKTEETENAKKARAEEAEKQAELEKEEASEYTEYAEQEQSAEEIENQLEESNEKETGNAIDNALENTNFTAEQKDKVSEVLNDETTTTPEKADAIVDAAGEQFDLFQKQEGLLYQLAGEPSIRRMAESEEKRRILADLDAAVNLEKIYKDFSSETRALRIRRATGWERDANGQWKYELDDSVNRIKGGAVLNGLMRTSPELLSQASEKAMLNLGDIYDAPELYKVFPYMKNVRVSFYSDPNAFRAVLTPEGIKVNMRYLQGIDGEKGLKGALVHEIQHVVQAMEYAESKGLQGADIEQLYNDMMDAMQAAGERKYDYDLTSLQQGLEAYMNDYGEIEARNVARRVMYNPDKRRNTTLESDEDIKRQPQLLYQITDLTQDFADISSGKITEQDVENHIMSLIGQTYDTATEPLKIQLVKGNKAHVMGSNVRLNPNQQKKHNAALNKVESIINNASMIGKSEPVDLTHNTNKRTLKHKQQVLKYVTFESPIKIGNDYYTVELITERVKGQAPELLDLYNVRVRKNSPANTLSNPNGSNALSQGQSNNNITTGNVNTGVLLYMEDASARAADQTMYGIHNLSADNLRHVLKMGGLANPSVAVVDTEKSNFTNFGEISLIPYNYMLEKGPGMKGTYGADIYSPRYPSLTITITGEGYDTIANIVKAVKDVDPELASTVEGKIANGIEYHGNEKRFLYDYFRIPFLAEQGYKDFYYRNESKFGNEIMDEYRKIENREEGAKTMRELYEQFIEKKYDKELVDELKEDLKDPDKEFNLLSAFNRQLWNESQYAGKIDYSGSERNADKIISENPELKEKFEKYVDEKLESIDRKERIFNGYTPSGNRRYLEHTLENVSKYMKQQGLEGGENFYYGLGSTRAKFTPRFTTLNQIKKARDRIVSKEDFDAIKEDMNERFDEIAERLDGGHGIDVGGARFEEAFTYGKSNPIEYLRNEYDLYISEDFAQDILNFAYELKEMPTEYFEAKFERPVYLNEFAGAIVPSNLSKDLKDALQNEGLLISEYNNEDDRQQATKDALEAFNQTRRILFMEDADSRDIQQQINELMTMEKAADMIQRAFVLGNIKEWYDGEYANGDEWLKARGVDEVAMYVDNEWQIQDKFLNNIPALMNGDFTSADIIEAYANGTLTGPQQKKENLKPIDLSIDTGFKDDRFYAPQKIDMDARELLEKASVKVTDANRKEVYKARADFITASHDEDFAERVGMSQSAINKKIMSWGAYPAKASKISNSINNNVALQNQWTGIVNSNLLRLFSIDKDQLMSMVKDVQGNPSEYQLNYVTSVILALDTHIDFSGLTYEFNANIEKTTTAANYSPSERTIHIKRDSLNTIAHETGHALDHLWGREILGKDDYLTRNVRFYANSDKITDPNVKSFLRHFADFLESIENVSDLHNEYTMNSQEVFARFVARFTEWTRNVATNDRFGFESSWYNDKFTVQQYYDFAKLLQEKAALDTTKQYLHFQKAYHGSAVDFDKFDTNEYAKTGEGSMSFGYGAYVTDSEEIAREYAERQAHQKYPEENRDLDAIVNYMQGHNIDFEEAKKLVLEQNLRFAEPYQRSKIKEDFANYKESDLTYKGKARLYTVEIPDDGYLNWKEEISKEDAIEIANKFIDYTSKNGFDINAKKLELPEEWSYDGTITGQGLYIRLDQALYGTGTEKIVSRFLNSIGYAGIKYPAGTIHGNGNGAYNYVIFNDDDAKIIDHLLFQTNAELMQEAQGFDSWQEFMEFCEVMHSLDDVSPIPSEADAQWYQSFWETAHGLQTEQEKNEQAVQDKAAKEDATAPAMDALFVTYIRQNPEMLDDFLHEAARIDAIDLDSDEWRNAADEADAAERDRIDQLKDAIAITMSDYNWQSAMRRVQGGGEISEGMRKRLMGEMTDTMKSRDFRALYAEVMEDAQYAVDEEDTTAAMLSKKLQKYQKRYYDIVKPGEDISKMSPEKRKRIAEAMANRDIANKIRNGSLKLDDELDAYIKSLDSQIKEKQKQFDELEKETKADYQRIADAEKRRLLKLHDELLVAKAKVTQKNSDTARKINKGLKITEKYKRESQNLQANYDELFRKFNDLKNTIQITAEVQAALDRQEQVANVREDLNAKQKEKNLTAEVKKMRINLVKRTMRRVPFNRIDYDNAKTVIAIQRMLEPNLIGGVNRFIGIDSPFLRGVISQVVTDSEYKEKLMNYLEKNSRASEAFVNFKRKLAEMKSIKDFDSWTAKERKAAIKYLPKENWVRDLNLRELAKEREESIDLDIDTVEYSRPAYDANGKPKTYKDADGNEQPVMETAFRLSYSDELGQLVKDAVGADMFDRIINRPFSEWTTEELEKLAQRIDELYTEGRDLLAAKNEAKRREAEAIRRRVEDAIKETGIVINDDDTPEEKERKQNEINKILNLNSGLKGTEAGKEKGIKAKLDRLIHGYSDMNVLRFARMLDNQSEGENVYMLYRREDECYNSKTRSINSRARAINEIMKANNITEGDLAKSIPVPSLNTEFTVDELLYFLAADKDYAEDETKLAKGLFGIDANDDWAATSRNAVMFGNMMSDTLSQEQKETWDQMDKQMQDAIKNDTLTTEQKQLKALGQLDEHPGTSAYINTCHARWLEALAAANNFLAEHPEYTALMEAIEADYAAQYERMNEVSITEFNTPVHRVKAYVPLVRRESNGDTNVNQVKEDLLGAYGAASGKQWVNKGMTQRRVNISPLNQKPVQTGLFATWGSSVERTEHFIAYAPYVRQLNAVYKSRDASYTRRFIESRYGKNAVKYLDDYINEVANPNAGKIREAGAEWLHTFRGRTAPAYLGWKFSAIIKQGLTSPWPYMQFVNPAEYAAAALECTRKGTYDAIKEKSVFMNNRVMDPMNELVEEMAEEGKTKFDRALGKFGKKGMAGLEWIDWVCVAPGWLACYKKEYARLQRGSEARYEAKMEELRERNMYADIATSQYMTPDQMEAQARKEIMEDIEVEAVRYADDCTRQCQPSSRAADLAPLFKNSSEAMKAFLQFQTSLNVIWQNIRYDMPYAVRNKQFQRIAGTIMGYVFAGIFMNSVMDGVTSGADDDDDKELQALRNLIFYSTTQFTDAIPMIGSEVTNTMDQIITGKRGFMQSGTDMTPSATKLLSVLTNASKGNWEKAATLSAEAIGMAAGAPVSGIKEINKLLGKPLEEGDVNLLRGLSDVYGIAGDFIEE